jgi:predicted amidohydrolase
MSPKDNIKRIDSLIAEATPSDIYVLPEMWNTGFVTDQAVSIDQNDTINWMKATAKKYNAAICGSLCVNDEEGKSRNRIYFVKPEGDITTYDKRHLFGYSGEDKYYDGGEKRVVVEFRGLHFLLAICYDLRFPVWLRYQEDYDAMIIVANWPESRQYAWQTLIRARAIENQCHVVACNRVGKDKMCSYSGMSAIIDSRGIPLIEAEANREMVITSEIDINKQNHYREKHRDLYNRDNFKITR